MKVMGCRVGCMVVVRQSTAWLSLFATPWCAGVYTGTPYNNSELVGAFGMHGEGHTGSNVLLVLNHCIRSFGDKPLPLCAAGYDKVGAVRNCLLACLCEQPTIVVQ